MVLYWCEGRGALAPPGGQSVQPHCTQCYHYHCHRLRSPPHSPGAHLPPPVHCIHSHLRSQHSSSATPPNRLPTFAPEGRPAFTPLAPDPSPGVTVSSDAQSSRQPTQRSVSSCVYIGWQWCNFFISYCLCLLFSAILWGKLCEMFVILTSLS